MLLRAFAPAVLVIALAPPSAVGQDTGVPARRTAAELASYLEALDAALKPYADKKVTLSGADISQKEAMEAIRKSVGTAPELSPGTLERDLPLALEFQDTPALDVLGFLVEVTGWHLVLGAESQLLLVRDDEVGRLAHPAASEAALLRAVESHLWMDGDPVEEPDQAKELRRKIPQTRVTVRCRDQAMATALEALSDASGIKVALAYGDAARKDFEKATVTLEAADQPFAEVLESLCKAHGLAWFVDYAEIGIASPAFAAKENGRWARMEEERKARIAEEAKVLAREVTLGGDAMTLRQIGEALEKQLGVPCRLDLDAWRLEKSWTFDGKPRAVSAIVKKLAAGQVAYRHGTLWILGDGE